MTNNLMVGYTQQEREPRATRGQTPLFPFSFGGRRHRHTTFGNEPFTPSTCCVQRLPAAGQRDGKLQTNRITFGGNARHFSTPTTRSTSASRVCTRTTRCGLLRTPTIGYLANPNRTVRRGNASASRSRTCSSPAVDHTAAPAARCDLRRRLHPGRVATEDRTYRDGRIRIDVPSSHRTPTTRSPTT